MAHNPNCDGSHCVSATGPVRLYPLGGSANLIVCIACCAHENRYRAERGRETGAPENWPVLQWASLKPYPVEG